MWLKGWGKVRGLNSEILTELNIQGVTKKVALAFFANSFHQEISVILEITLSGLKF